MTERMVAAGTETLYKEWPDAPIGQRAATRLVRSILEKALASEETRSSKQNRMMWPLIKDIREQVPGHEQFSPDDTKLRFLHALGQEMRFLPELDGGGMFPVGQRSSVLTKGQFAALLTLMLEYGDRNGVVWSLPSQQIREEAQAA